MTKSINKYYEWNPLSHFYEFGLSPQEVKTSIIDSFTPYFETKANLEKHASSDLVNIWLLHLSIGRDYPKSLTAIADILSIFNGAKKVNQNLTMDAYIGWLPEIYDGMSRFWTLLNHTPSLDKLCIEDFLEISMSTIGTTIEGVLKNFLVLLLQLNRIKRNKPFDISALKSADLGVVIDELINTSNLSRILIIAPDNIRLNQWRNIAYHHNTKVVDSELVISYIQKGKRSEFILSRDELFHTVKKIVLTFKLIRTSEMIFCFDNLESIQQAIDHSNIPPINVRKEAEQIDFCAQISSQGFQVTNLEVTDTVSSLIVTDMQLYSDYIKRAAHASQFLFALWQYSNSPTLKVQYYTQSGELFFSSEIKSEHFASINENTQLSEALANAIFHVHKKGLQNENPFNNLKISTKLQKANNHFLSQHGEKLTLQAFITQFTLSLFCNYLVLISEGFSHDEISLTISSDGATAIGKGEKGTAVLGSPAFIHELKIQKILTKSIRSVIRSFCSSKLKVEIVEDAITNNKFYYKKHLVKSQLK